MGFVESLKGLIYDILHNLDRINVDYITSNGLNPLRIRHDSGALIELRDDGKAYYNDVEIGAGGAGLWEVDGTETQLITADAIDMQSESILNCNVIGGATVTASTSVTTPKVANTGTLTFENTTGTFVFSKV